MNATLTLPHRVIAKRKLKSFSSKPRTLPSTLYLHPSLCTSLRKTRKSTFSFFPKRSATTTTASSRYLRVVFPTRRQSPRRDTCGVKPTVSRVTPRKDDDSLCAVRKFADRPSSTIVESSEVTAVTLFEKSAVIDSLIDIAVAILDSIWPLQGKTTVARETMSLRLFVRQTLKLSNTSYSVFQTVLIYLHRAKAGLARRRRLMIEKFSVPRSTESFDSGRPISAAHPPCPVSTDRDESDLSSCAFVSDVKTPDPITERWDAQKDSVASGEMGDPTFCGRRMFLAAVISASKYLNDKNYSNRAWSKLMGLSIAEINGIEMAFLHLVGYTLYVPLTSFIACSQQLSTYVGHRPQKECLGLPYPPHHQISQT